MFFNLQSEKDSIYIKLLPLFHTFENTIKVWQLVSATIHH